MPVYNYKKGLTAMLGCFFIWGFQPLYWYLCSGMDTFFLMASRIVWAAVCCVLILWIQGKLPQLAAAFKDKAVCWSALWATTSSRWWCSPSAR